jgi:exopolysaccharide biosynthesis polyprenyl glycosylphosphotransferase
VVILVIFLRQELFNSRFLVVGYWAAATVAAVAGRLSLRLLQRRLIVRYDIGVHRVLLIGNDGVTERLERTMISEPELGWRVVKRLADPDLAEIALSVGNPGADEVVLANPDYPAAKIVQLVDFCHEHHLVFKFVPNIYQTLTTHYDVDAIGRIPVVELKRTALDGWGRVFKRMFDIVSAAAALAVLSPLFAFVAFAIKWETEGPVFVRLRRVSRNREFELVKFRSMIDNAHEFNGYLRSIRNDRTEGGPLWKMRDDPRITRVGRLIRKYRIDEFPQFWNVLKGDMSIVGPRPHQSDEIARYQKHHRKVLAIKAGATGLVQASGASDMPFEEEVVLDTFYVENWSLWLDLRICLQTAARIVSDHSAV